MVHVRLGTLTDLDKINSMLRNSIMPPITVDHFNDKDIILVAEYEKDVMGCLYVGVFANGTHGYIDKFYIAPHYARKQVGQALSRAAINESMNRGLVEVFGVIQHTMHHDKSAMNALKAAMGSDGKLYTYVNGNVPQMALELGL